ncbi:DNA-binding IclR family transcriptional regulator [Endobacter medicaginis]|jgi:DNA-binding IclR family transcriptional regulator|uniref:DNA-binding IclR family transcriptional regulator n=1 Tax=Endobacter medicaginis TaxID=1181271 RepID=A0A850NNF9_9PROT|nr:IclR family transcriptional regulator C-terminal domain-containing protein [Endobacter medicaginis]MBB3175012.1 DNA-binding IclR family transcriptional regulator [Endobacter medicaginis]MCX5475934.1 helix-turn-helix domain-containing protein [Endobacter medicaginis]NVN28862.1 helix-turn-helix domain-containing protein [Endobacter medicaginis]
MAAPDRLVSVIGLFTLERPVWGVDDAAEALDVSVSSVYRYFATLCEAGFLATETPGQYVLGPAFIQYDRQIRLTDPLLAAARPVMADLVTYAPDGSTAVLARVFEDKVICVHQVVGRGPQPQVSYARGRPMPLFRGATSKIILAHLPPRQLKRLYQRNAATIAETEMGRDLASFRETLASMRRAGVVVTRHEIDPDRVGIAAPVFSSDRRILGSLSVIVGEDDVDQRLARLQALTIGCAGDIETALAAISPKGNASGASEAV